MSEDGYHANNILQVDGLSDKANLGERYVIFSVVFARWQHYIRRSFALSGNSKEFFHPILHQNADPDHHQHLITSKLGQV